MLRPVLIACAVATVFAWPSGAPEEACSTMTPLHGYESQEGECPWLVDALPFVAGEKSACKYKLTRREFCLVGGLQFYQNLKMS